MSENQADLHADLARLRQELAELDAGDDVARRRIEELIDNIDKRLDEAATAEQHRHLTEMISDSIEQFEVEHPRATAILNQIAMTLSNMGI